MTSTAGPELDFTSRIRWLSFRGKLMLSKYKDTAPVITYRLWRNCEITSTARDFSLKTRKNRKNCGIYAKSFSTARLIVSFAVKTQVSAVDWNNNATVGNKVVDAVLRHRVLQFFLNPERAFWKKRKATKQSCWEYFMCVLSSAS